MAKRNGGNNRARRRVPERTPPLEVTISHVGGRGDGVAERESETEPAVAAGHRRRPRPVFVPTTLPGERVAARPVSESGEGVACQLTEILQASEDRVTPGCPHFGTCGGCALQHWAEQPYRQWKRERVIAAIRRSGLEVGQVDDLVPALPETRRRADFVIRRLEAGAVIGFHERGSNRIIDLETCLVLEPKLTRLAFALRGIVPLLLAAGETARITVNLLDSGLDLLLTLPREPGLEALEALAMLAESRNLCRIATRLEKAGEDGMTVPMLERKTPIIVFAGVDVRPPPGVFLQATGDGARDHRIRARRHWHGGTDR